MSSKTEVIKVELKQVYWIQTKRRRFQSSIVKCNIQDEQVHYCDKDNNFIMLISGYYCILHKYISTQSNFGITKIQNICVIP